MKVLLLVDLQRDFCPGGRLAVEDGDKIIEIINRLMKEGGYDLIVATQDWHPADHGSFAVNHPGMKVFDKTMLDGLVQILWPEHCVQNTLGAEFHPDLDTSSIHHVVRKGQDRLVDSYSGFADNGNRRRTELGAILDAEAAVRGESAADVEIDVVGLALDYCVSATAMGAVERGHKVSLVVDATRAVDQRPESVTSVLRDLQRQGVALIESRERLPERSESLRADTARTLERGMSL